MGKREILSHQKNISSNQLFGKNRYFHEIFTKNAWERILVISTLCTVWKLRNFTATIFSQKFREINFLLKNFTLSWFDEKKLDGSEFLVFPHCVPVISTLRKRDHAQKFPWNQLFSNFFSKYVDLTEKLLIFPYKNSWIQDPR